LSFLAEELDGLVGKGFPKGIPFERLQHFPRYLKALRTRADRALLAPAKDLERTKQIRPYLDALCDLNSRGLQGRAARQALNDFRWLLEEFKVSVFAQELGTAQPVSPKRLDAQWQRIRELEQQGA
jgi:ATP-dependent helicase HrpA